MNLFLFRPQKVSLPRSATDSNKIPSSVLTALPLEPVKSEKAAYPIRKMIIKSGDKYEVRPTVIMDDPLSKYIDDLVNKYIIYAAKYYEKVHDVERASFWQRLKYLFTRKL